MTWTTSKWAVLFGLLISGAGVAAAKDAEPRLATATAVFKEVMAIPDKSIPQDLLNKAQCLIVVPGVKKGAFILGAKYGRGFVTCRRKDGAGWSSPGSIRIEGGSFGFQIGGAELDVLMLVMNERGMDRLLSSKFTLGGDATAAAGPVGRNVQAETDAAMTAEILTWSRSRGLFGGISLTGATLREDSDWNTELYGKPYRNRDLVTGSGTTPPKAAEELLKELDRYSSRK
jgi:SH3 domain-containing YSC84-like protein 1